MRAKLSKQVEDFKKELVEIFDELLPVVAKGHYLSITAEQRANQTFNIHSKAQNFKERIEKGLVVRLFDGFTLHEYATPKWNKSEILKSGRAFLSSIRMDKNAVHKPYPVPTWKDRLSFALDSEIKSQIPENVDAKTWVHFGTRVQGETLDKTVGMNQAKDIFSKLCGFDPGMAPDYLAVTLGHAREEFLFIDQETRLSQTVYRSNVRMVAVKGEDRGFNLIGGLGGTEFFTLKDEDYKDVYRRLGDLMRAERIKPGRYSVVMSPDVTGVFAHEAFGHTQEGDTWLRGRSIAKDLYEKGIQVGNEHATILNNPAVYKNGIDETGAWGSYFFDEEGWLAGSQELVKGGYLRPPMTSLQTAHRLGVPRTANAKREKWSHGVYVRQTNTYFSPGDKSFQELIKMTDYGFYAEDSAGGMEDPKGMGIQVGISCLYEIKNGELTGKVFKGPNGGAVQMTGSVPDYLHSIRAKSKIDAYEKGSGSYEHPYNTVGGCAKYHKEVVMAGCGGPFMLVDNVLLG